MSAREIADQIKARKRDLEKLLNSIEHAKMRFFVSQPDEYSAKLRSSLFCDFKPPVISCNDMTSDHVSTVFTDISTDVDGMKASYLAPGLHLNQYLEALASDVEWDEVKYDIEERESRPSNVLRRVSVEVHAHAVLVSLKSALDRLVRVFAHYVGVSPHTTWGRYDEKGNPKSFMAEVARRKNDDELFRYLDDAYHKWISAAVAPRDVLIHYRDSVSTYTFLPDDGALVQTHIITKESDSSYGLNLDNLVLYVTEWYKLTDFVLLELAGRLPRRLMPPRQPGRNDLK